MDRGAAVALEPLPVASLKGPAAQDSEKSEAADHQRLPLLGAAVLQIRASLIS